MGRQSQDEVRAAARRRLDLLRRELEQAGLRRVDEDDEDDEADEDSDRDLAPDLAPRARLSDSRPVPRAGRHARPSRNSSPGPVARARDLVPPTLRGTAGMASGPVLLVVAMVAVAAVVTGVAVVRMHSGGEAAAAPAASPSPLVRAAPGPARPAATSPASSPGSAAASGAAASGASATVTVDVAGKVRRPGVRTLRAGSRVVDALRQAGGARPGVDLTGLNLARVLVDGEQILVGRPAPPGGLAASSSTGAPPATTPLVNLNSATEQQLETLPGVGPVTAQKILQWRAAHGAFSAVDELLEVDGIGEKTLADLAPLVTL